MAPCARANIPLDESLSCLCLIPFAIPRCCGAPCWLQAAPKGGPLTGGGDASAVRLHFDQPQWAVTTGQSAVLYDGDVCLGGGVIDGFE